MSCRPGRLEGIVKLAHHLRGFDIYRVLVTECPLLNAKNETEGLYMLGKLP
jgi:hypothetical protein